MKYRAGVAFPDADQFMVNELDAAGRYQASHLAAAMAYVTDRCCAIDGGAHVGVWSRQMSALFARVIAVEPSPDTFAALSENLSGCPNVELRHVALGAAAGWVSMAWDARNAARANTGARYVQSDGPISMVAIDEWELPALGFLKLDVEGSECDALRGATQTLVRCRPVVLFEEKGFGQRFGHAPEAVPRLLTSLGYRHLQDIGCDRIWGPTS